MNLVNPRVISLAEQIADWRMRIRLWNIVHRRYILALRHNERSLAHHLFKVLRETKVAQ